MGKKRQYQPFDEETAHFSKKLVRKRGKTSDEDITLQSSDSPQNMDTSSDDCHTSTSEDKEKPECDNKSQQNFIPNVSDVDETRNDVGNVLLDSVTLNCYAESVKNFKNKGDHHYSCTFCCKTFTKSDKLKKHVCVHSGEHPYCTECNKTFSTAQYLKIHMRIHTGESQYVCPVCSKAFIQNSNLTCHLRQHTGERPFICTVCCKTFISGSVLNQHLRTHSSDSPFKCTVCSKTFKWKSNLTTHIRIHTGERPFCCTVCSKTFTDGSTLKKHLRVHCVNAPSVARLSGRYLQ